VENDTVNNESPGKFGIASEGKILYTAEKFFFRRR